MPANTPPNLESAYSNMHSHKQDSMRYSDPPTDLSSNSPYKKLNIKNNKVGNIKADKICNDSNNNADKNSKSDDNSQQFCLRWNNYQSNLTSVFDQLLQNESFVDVTLACDGHSIKAHKMVLSACSPYFQSLFFDNPCQHPIIIMRDVKWPELKAIVEFMYKGEINVCQDQISPLLSIAEMLQIRGLAEVNGGQESELPQGTSIDKKRNTPSVQEKPKDKTPEPTETVSNVIDIEEQINQQQKERQKQIQQESKKPRITPRGWESMAGPGSDSMTPPPNKSSRKRRWPSTERHSVGSPNESATENLEAVSPVSNVAASLSHTPTSIPSFPLPNPLDPMALQQLSMNNPDDMEIKPGIAEMIREEERAKMLENSQAWLGASSSSIAAESYQYQLQSMWQKCWNSQNLIHHLRFRERGPLKSWRPETMAEAIFSVLKEGLSLSQAARKYDIPYPTFVLYANRVHNMLGPSIDGGPDLRPKGRGRPQRILLGIWPEEHIKEVIKSVVFRDAKDLKDEQQLLYGRQSPFPFQDGFGQNPNGITPQNPGGSESMSPDAAMAAMAAMRQQMSNMCNMADMANLVAGFNLPPHMSIHPTAGGGNGSDIPVPKVGTPVMSSQMNKSGGESSGGIPIPRLGSPAINSSMYNLATGMGLHGLHNLSPQSDDDRGHRNRTKDRDGKRDGNRGVNDENDKDYNRDRNNKHKERSNNLIHNQDESAEHHPLSLISNNHKNSLSITRLDALDTNSVRINSSPHDKSSHGSPHSDIMEPAINLAIDNQNSINGDDIHDKSKSPNFDESVIGNRTNSNRFNESPNIKMEPLTECRE